MISFFELSFEEWCQKRGFAHIEAHCYPAVPCAYSLEMWRAEATALFAKIKESDHYHNGVPCREFHASPVASGELQ